MLPSQFNNDLIKEKGKVSNAMKLRYSHQKRSAFNSISKYLLEKRSKLTGTKLLLLVFSVKKKARPVLFELRKLNHPNFEDSWMYRPELKKAGPLLWFFGTEVSTVSAAGISMR